ncbi:YTH domain-containing protein ECT4 isoform X2 [Capsicum annuum]|uniref:YTH domain-containing protein ECT4 isoform X2 n=1 Tax=Capsicum annuum TaxID=4072 RepID=UPI0007BF0527|nr:YTH domain-containing protein ECT4 isoform X2 [Capsicum annuum]
MSTPCFSPPVQIIVIEVLFLHFTAIEAADLLQKLSLDSQNKTLEISEPKKKPSVDSKDVGNGQIQSVDRSVTPVLPDFMDPTLCYVPNGYPSTAYYYGYDGSGNEWEDYSRYVNSDGVDMTGAYGDNGSLMYHHGYGYAAYSPYSPATSPVPTVGHDGQLYGAQHYHYPYFQPVPPTSTPYATSVAPPKGEISTSSVADQAPLSVDSATGKSNGIANGPTSVRPAFQSSSLNTNGSFGRGAYPGGVASGYQDPRFGFDGVRSPIPWLDGSIFNDGQARIVTGNSVTPSFSNGSAVLSSKNQNVHPHVVGLHHPRPSSGMNTTNGYMNRMYPNKYYGQYGNTFSSGMGFGSNRYDSRTTGRGWMAVDNRFKPRGRGSSFYGYGNENMDGLNELNRGPRGKGAKNQKGITPVALAVKGQNIPLNVTNDAEKDKPSLILDREQYNCQDFPVTYTDAKFFIIKSYSEDDVHKSIKYNVWASTPNGNKKLDAAYQEAQQKSGSCPVFLFFSVNTSGQFVGVAEMVGPVDFNKNVDYWQQDKWIGCFPVKWHIVKDVPNSLLKHITLENNENKPVTNSRDTQEVKMDQGQQLLKIFKDHISKQCILDDFEFYEDRQKRIQEKKAKQQLFQKQPQVWEGKVSEEKNKENANSELNSQKPSEVSAVLNKEGLLPLQPNGQVKLAENVSVTKLVDDVKGAKPVIGSDKKPVANGIANGVANAC